eukprot:NODE_2098_length_1206_cov_44.738116_g1738_i0.p1 GENE.NODE_2098_length_1206_cov_44.738116_g1738_i0~~NODE_2098_length_1206_cov_44.738116_g1738_i0.p1  ORF type:complete len:283 (-),score=68.21 NODE_2098_length_1206_cov_44.738116_g1738_i0:63-911(-)
MAQAELIEPPCLIREVFYAPECPQEIVELLETALVHQNSSNYSLAIQTYLQAQNEWEILRGWEQINPQEYERYKHLPEIEKERFRRNVLTPVPLTDEAQIYIRLSVASVFQSAGQDENALAELMLAHKIALALPPQHLSLASIYSSLGTVYCHLSQYDFAGDYFLKALDIREQNLGSRHMDTASTMNNIGVVLHNMDRCVDALKMYAKAEEVFKLHFSLVHPRLATVQRNIEKAKKRYLKVSPTNMVPPAEPPAFTSYKVPLVPGAYQKPKPKAKKDKAGRR